jgi:predicted metal-dependent hydrolase
MSPRTAATYPDIPRRKIDFDFDPDKVPLDFYGGDPIQSLFMASLSLVFPEGERFFVDSVMHYRDRLDDPELAAAVKGFAAQEGNHARAHAAFNAMVRAQGLEVAVDLERKVKHLLRFRKKTAPAAARLAVTCALEHFTAILAEQLLTDEDHRERLHPSVRDLWVWHALEESEHKAVAFDVFQKVSGSYAIRARVMLIATAFFMGFIAYSHMRLVKERGLLTDVRGLFRTFDSPLAPAWPFPQAHPGLPRLFPAGLPPGRQRHDSPARRLAKAPVRGRRHAPRPPRRLRARAGLGSDSGLSTLDPSLPALPVDGRNARSSRTCRARRCRGRGSRNCSDRTAERSCWRRTPGCRTCTSCRPP